MNNPLEPIIQFLKTTDQLQTASTLLKAFRLHSTQLDQFDLLGKLFMDVKDYQSSLICTQEAFKLATTPSQKYAVRSNLAKLYNHMNNPQAAIECIQDNLSINPNDYEAKMELLFSNYLAANFQESRRILEELLYDPNTPEDVRNRCEFNQGSYLLDDGDFKNGLLGFIDVGHRIGIWPKYDLPLKQWYGEVIPNATIAIIAEGGIGDEVINVRFAKNIEQLGMHPVFVTGRKDIRTLFQKNGFKTAGSICELPQDTLAIKAMYLPIALDLDKDQLYTGPYLKPDPVYIQKWGQLLPKGKKAALRWSGNPAYEQDLSRSLSLDIYMDAYKDLDVTFISVQKDHDMEALSKYPEVFDASPYLETLDDLLACLSLCNCTVTSCTSVAHISAASGCKTYVFPPIATYYVWLGDAKWYGDNVIVNRQTKPKDWSFIKSIKLDI